MMKGMRNFLNQYFCPLLQVILLPMLAQKQMCIRDSAKILEYRNTKKALSDHVDEEDKYQGDGVTIREDVYKRQAISLHLR